MACAVCSADRFGEEAEALGEATGDGAAKATPPDIKTSVTPARLRMNMTAD